MGAPDYAGARHIPLTISQQNIYRGVLQDGDPALYLIGRTYRFTGLPLQRFLTALHAAIANNPVQLCVLEPHDSPYPELAARLQPQDLIVIGDEDPDQLMREWDSGIMSRPLMRYTVRTNGNGDVVRLDMRAHHIALDGGATGLIESDLGRYLSDGVIVPPDVSAGLDRLAQAHHREQAQVFAAHQRLTDALRRELADQNYLGVGLPPPADSGQARRAVRRESLRIADADYDAIIAMAELRQIPLPVVVTAATVAVDAARRHSSQSLVVHAVDNRFGEPDLQVATCLVNSVAQAVRFPAFASVGDLVTTIDRGYVAMLRRRWFREELYRRIYLTLHRTAPTEAIALNFLREPCAPELRAFLETVPLTTDIGPIECPTVAVVHDEQRRTLDLVIWDSGNTAADTGAAPLTAAIAATLTQFTTRWDLPAAISVGQWSVLDSDGSCARRDDVPAPAEPGCAAWFLDPACDIGRWRRSRRFVDGWIGWLVDAAVEPGAVVVFTDDHTDKTVDLMIACHLAGCGYSVCEDPELLSQRAEQITAHTASSCTVIDVAATELPRPPAGIDRRLAATRDDSGLAHRIAYVIGTSGTTGAAKLVPISHAALALFCQGHHAACGWEPHDTVVQCAPLTSDISVEEIFGAAFGAATLIRSSAIRNGNLTQLCDDVMRHRASIVDLPTAIWQLCCEQTEILEAFAASTLRQLVIGGEEVRTRSLEKWIATEPLSHIALISSYGPTETTVVATYLPLSTADAARRVGRPIAPNTVFVAFGEIVIAGQTVSSGYLGRPDAAFGTVIDNAATTRRIFATADRVNFDDQGFPVFAGRKDAVVKLAGQRVDTAEITRLIADDPTIGDVAVELAGDRLGVWFTSTLTAADQEDRGAEQRIRGLLRAAGVPGFAVTGLSSIPRKAGGKVDSDLLPAADQEPSARETAGVADGLAQLWASHLDRPLHADSSLLGEGIGSLELIRILPATRRYLERHLSLLDVISADSASTLVETTDTMGLGLGMDEVTIEEITRDLPDLNTAVPCTDSGPLTPDTGTVLVLGATGILGTGFAAAARELRDNGFHSELVLATTSTPPQADTWRALAGIDGVRVEHTSRQRIAELIARTKPTVVVNAIGNTNVVVPYRELRPANVQAVGEIVAACADHGARLVHLSTSVVSPQPETSWVLDPRAAPYPYAASKALAELIVTAGPRELAFSLVRLPRVLGEPHQLRQSADILIALADACAALDAHPVVHVIEDVTSSRSAARAIVDVLTHPHRRAVIALRGTPVDYQQFLARFGSRSCDIEQFKQLLDASDWARANPRRWAVIDAWITLGLRLGDRSYQQYLAALACLELPVDNQAHVSAAASDLAEIVAHGCGGELLAPVGRLLTQEVRTESTPKLMEETR